MFLTLIFTQAIIPYVTTHAPLIIYGCKLYLLVKLLQRFSVKLHSVLLVQGESSELRINLSHYNNLPNDQYIGLISYMSGNLFMLMILIEELEKCFLKRCEEVLANNDSSHNKVYYDDNMDITALYITTKEQLRQCKEDYEELTDKYEQYRENAECKRKELEMQLNTLEKDLTKLKETKENIKQLQCCICHEKQLTQHIAATMQPFITM